MATLIQNSLAPAFTGEFRHKIEGKNRVTIPSAWRFEDEVELFMIKRRTQKCIGVMSRAEVERLKAKATDTMTPENRARFLETFGRQMRQVPLDKAGRISIPEELRAEFNISGEVWLSGAVDTFNIWNVADFEADKAAQSPADDQMMRQLGI